MVVEELLRQGKSIEDARAGGTCGCVETGAFGKEAYILTGYFNTAKVLEITLDNGLDPRTGKQIGIETGDPREFATYEELFEAFRRQLRHFIDIKIRGNNVIERLYAEYMPAPFLSLLVEDCIAKGRDYNDGGPRYNTTYIMGTSPGSVTDSLSAIRYPRVRPAGPPPWTNCWQRWTRISPATRSCACSCGTRRRSTATTTSTRTASCGQVFDAFYDEINGRPNTKGGAYRVNYLSTTCHVYFGSVTGATPDGRRAWEPLSDGISPAQGADRHGPTAVIQSAAKLDHARTGGTLLNQKFSPAPGGRARAGWTTWRTWCARISSSTGTTFSSTW